MTVFLFLSMIPTFFGRDSLKLGMQSKLVRNHDILQFRTYTPSILTKQKCSTFKTLFDHYFYETSSYDTAERRKDQKIISLWTALWIRTTGAETTAIHCKKKWNLEQFVFKTSYNVFLKKFRPI